MIRRHHIVAAAAAAATALLLVGCGGGGGGGSAQGDVPAPGTSLPVASGAGPEQSASLAIAALGSPGAVDPAGAGQKLSGYDSFGTPHNAFAQQVSDGSGSGSEPGTAAAIPGDTPINGDNLVAVPSAAPTTTAPGTVTNDPGAGAPVQNPRALEADFDISGEPVVAREGDSIPPETQQFLVKTVLASEVVLELSGGLLPDGTDTVTLKEGEAITLYNATAKRSYRIKLVDVRAA